MLHLQSASSTWILSLLTNSSPEAVNCLRVARPNHPPDQPTQPPSPALSSLDRPGWFPLLARAPPRRSQFVSSVSSRSADGRSERTDSGIESGSRFVISARLVFDLKAVFACLVRSLRKNEEKIGEGVNYPDEDKERKWKDVIRSSLRLCAVPIREGASYKEEDRGEVSSSLIDMQRLSTLTKDTASP